jgi:hypothetical protein
VRYFEVAGEILEYRCFAGSTPWRFEKAVVDLRPRLGLDRRGNVEHIVEGVSIRAGASPPPACRVRCGGTSYGRQAYDRRAERRIGVSGGMIDLMHDGEELRGRGRALHQPAYGRQRR